MPVKVRVEGHEELLRGSSHVEYPHYTVSPAAERLSRVVLWGPAQTASGMYTIFGILAMDQTDCNFGINIIKLTIVVQLTAYSFVSGHP